MLSRALLVVALAATPALAQLTEPQFFVVDHGKTTGSVSNDGTRTDVIASFVVDHPAVASLRLHFGEVHLAGSPLDESGSLIRMTSLQDGGQQVLNALQLQQWGHGSAWFNGSAVQVDLIAAPGTGLNVVSVNGLDVGIPLGAYESQCGPTDDRVPSNDPRVARLLPSGCTAWMVNDCAHCFLSAGHCGTGNNMVEFNVPFSTAGGGWNHPPPADQYSIDPGSYQSSNVFGNDWLYFGTFPNPGTGLTAFQSQGAGFDLVSPPPLAGNTIRITGHGTDSTPNSTYNQVQQTHVGPFTSNGSPLQYQVDTTGGNSGSPIIWEQSDAAIGIHTNAGCSTSGGGSNSGTPITVAALQNALANPQGICALGGFGNGMVDLGNGKYFFPPFTEPPSFGGCASFVGGEPYTFVLELPNLLGSVSTAYLVLGFGQINVPFKGGVMVPSVDLVVTFPLDTSGTSGWTKTMDGTWPLGVPSGTNIVAQWWISYDSVFWDDYLASNAVGITTP